MIESLTITISDYLPSHHPTARACAACAASCSDTFAPSSSSLVTKVRHIHETTPRRGPADDADADADADDDARANGSDEPMLSGVESPLLAQIDDEL